MSSPSNELEIESKSKGLSKEALEAHNRENRSSVAGSSVPSTVFSRSISQMALSDIVDYAIKKLETETSPEKRRKLSRLLALAEIDAKDAEALKKKYQISDSSSARAPSKAPSKASSKDSTLSDLDSADFISAELASPGSPPGNQANSETRDTDQSVMGPPPKPKPKKRTKLSADKVPGPYCNTFIAEIIPVNASLDDILQLWSDRNAFSELYVTGKLKQMVRNLAICTLKGRAQGRYVRWEIKSGAFWVAAELNSSHRDEATLAPPEKAKPLYLDLADGGPIGRIMYQLYTDPRRVTGLYAQAWGLNNTAPCQCCENRYKTSESDKHTGMWPFFGCRSIPNRLGGSCGVCCFSIAAHECSYRDDRFEHLRARYGSKVPIREDLNPENSPDDVRISGRELLAWIEERVRPLSQLNL